ncbi:MAG: sodium-dependent bicarbonate transport family permease [Acidimicrobiales bacterium]|nr:sodium-dependent bicarbonate transport family permease [Acidimicrobiales bacterium]
MDASVIKNLTDPAVLFFFLGVFVGLIRSNLEIPAPVAKFLSLYLLMALGFKGGQALGDAGLSGDVFKVVGAALVLATVIPALAFLALRRRVNAFDAAAIAATYGSVSAVTFVTASQFVAARGDAAGGYLTVALVLMESPAIIMAVLLATWVRGREATGTESVGPEPAGSVVRDLAVKDARTIVPEADHASGHRGPDEGPDPHAGAPLSIKEVLREAFTDGAHLLLIGSMVIGVVSGTAGGEAMDPFVNGIFKGLLAFFLLEMGLLVARQLREVRDVGPFLIAFGIAMPLVGAGLAFLIGGALRLDVGDLTLLAVLAASGSYIVVPAVIRYAIPEARPSRYFTLALGVTFPFNIVLGIPLYYAVAGVLGT